MIMSRFDVCALGELLISDSRIFHFGSLPMTGEICETATKKAVKAAKKNGLIISFDPNLRENLWESLDKAREKIEYGIANCDILKISDNEIQWFTGEQDFDCAESKLAVTTEQLSGRAKEIGFPQYALCI